MRNRSAPPTAPGRAHDGAVTTTRRYRVDWLAVVGVAGIAVVVAAAGIATTALFADRFFDLRLWFTIDAVAAGLAVTMLAGHLAVAGAITALAAPAANRRATHHQTTETRRADAHARRVASPKRA